MAAKRKSHPIKIASNDFLYPPPSPYPPRSPADGEGGGNPFHDLEARVEERRREMMERREDSDMEDLDKLNQSR